MQASWTTMSVPLAALGFWASWAFAAEGAAPAAAPAAVIAAAPIVGVKVDAAAGRRPISPYIYGKNFVGKDAAVIKEAGLRISRESGGNNCTKYNWRNDMSSHPDWYDNVYKQGWHERAQRYQREFDDMQLLFCFQVMGMVAKTDQFNFKEQEANPRPEPHTHLCGGGDGALFLQPWTAKDTVDILDYWFRPGGRNLDPKRFRYWHMDNEPDCWASTQKIGCPPGLTAEQCVQKYAAVAREVKTRYPNIRLMAPGFASEWMWWNWDNQFINGLSWTEFFIKRMAEESHAFGANLIDVVDIHTYGNARREEDVLQEHRILYDSTYQYPGANGCKRYPDGGWHDDQRVEMILARIEQWLDKYFGPGSGIGIGVTETDAPGTEMVRALWYASMLGTFADHGVEVFCPWGWHESWWEVLHLFSRYAGTVRVESRCTGETLVSAYASVNDAGDRMTVIFVNRNRAQAATADTAVAGFAPKDGRQRTLSLSNLPERVRTFKSRTENALQEGAVVAAGGRFSVELSPYSITAVLLSKGD